ncbi:MAG: hypothetical protein LUP94_02535 [Candidatus Methanomethylicus sp.]|nr:hypothetical protein [Candidatus Methanomethylicus sp.]
MRTLRKNRKGMTGIETAIIVIAFVIAASVFAFAILNMGLLTTQKAQEAITSGTGQATSALQLQTLWAYGNTTSGEATDIIILAKLAPGNTPIDFDYSKLTVSYKNNDVLVADVYAANDFESAYNQTILDDPSAKCTVMVVQGDSDTVLEQGEEFAVLLNLAQIDATDGNIAKYEHFYVDLIPMTGAKLTISASIPGDIQSVMTLLVA